MTKPPVKQTSPRVSKLASDVLADRIKPTAAQVKTLAGAALSNDETKGQARKAAAPKAAPKPPPKAPAKPPAKRR